MRVQIFTDGADYAGTRDTFLSQASPGSNFGTQPDFEWDTEEQGGVTTGLIRFDNIFGTGPTQVPANATITEATLELTVDDPSALPEAELRESTVTWGETSVTFDTFGGEPGIQQDELLDVVATVPIETGRHQIDITSSVAKWHGGAPNMGWAIVPRSTNGEHAVSREAATVADRPTLVVRYLVPL
jgi:hypothetical protein